MANRNFRSDENRSIGGRDFERHRRSGGSEGYRSQQGQYRNEDDNWWGRRSSFEGGPDADDEFEDYAQGRNPGRYGQPSRDWQHQGRDDFGGQRQFSGQSDSSEFSQRYGQSGQGQQGYGQGSGNQAYNQQGQGSGGRGQYSQGNIAGFGYSSGYGQGRSRFNPSSGQMGAGSGGYGPGIGGGYEGFRSGGSRSGTAADYSRRGPKNYQRSDERLKEDICDRLLHDVDVDASDVTVEVKSGKVTLEGSVPERYMKHTIEDIADGCYGVKEVDNKVRVSTQSAATTGIESQHSTSNTDAAAGRLK